MTANTAKEWGVFIRLNFNNESNYSTQLKQDIFRDVPWEFEGLLNHFCKRSFNLLMMISD